MYFKYLDLLPNTTIVIITTKIKITNVNIKNYPL